MEKGKKGSCRADLKKEVNELVDKVEGYTKEEKKKRSAEIKAAFDENETKKKK